MGIAWLLFQRTFRNRPKRTLLFLLGYALATTVMITLLSVGEAVLEQAQDKDLLGGGDLILVPQGIDVESMKMSGITALYYSIPQARFVVGQLLKSSRFREEIDAVSPYLFSKLLYARKSGSSNVEAVFAQGSFPDSEKKVKGITAPWTNTAEDEAWLNPTGSNFYHEIDRFHLPTTQSADLDRWAEWHYFNFESGTFHGYLSIMVTGDVTRNTARWTVSLQIVDPQYSRYSATYRASPSDLPLERVDYVVGQSAIRFVEDHYEISVRFHDRVPIRGLLRYYPEKGLFFPPAYLARRNDFESGYVIPAIRGKYAGSLSVGSKTYDFDNLIGYHDHNWGIWQQIRWNWGHLYSDEYALFFGEIFLHDKSKGLFVGLFDRSGFLSLFRPQQIAFSEYRPFPEGIVAPKQWLISQKKQHASLLLQGRARSLISTNVDGNNRLYFIQYRADYSVELEIDGKQIAFPATGSAETFVEQR